MPEPPPRGTWRLGVVPPCSGAEGARTPDLLGAIQALSQLSYSPVGKLNLDTAPLRDNPCKTNTGSPTGRAVEDGGGRWKAVRARRITALHRPPPHIIPMRPISLTYSGLVGVSIEEVFQLLSDASRMPEWLPNCTAAVPAPTKKGKGDRHRIHFERDGRKADCVIEVIEFVPPTTYAWVEIIHRRGAKTFFKLQFQGGATRITMKHVWTPSGLRAWLLGHFYRRRSAHRMFDGLLQNLRKALTR